jgi:hypothetical protein
MSGEDARPGKGDVIIYRCQASAPAPAYLLSVFERAFQISCPTYEEAVKQATGFASRDHVDVWYSEDQASYRLVAQYRDGPGLIP